jgi:hypothetical protein
MKTITSTDKLRPRDWLNVLLCAALVAGAILATNPFVEVAFNDDWMYAYTVRQLLRTGKIQYAAESTIFLTQAYWGALWARMFGFSFVSLRFSTMPFAVGCVILCYVLAREARLKRSFAFLTAILFGLSAVVLPLSASFMSDIPAEFAVLLSIYLFVRAARSAGILRTVGLLAAAYVTTVLGGLSRQSVWVVPVSCGVYVAYLRRQTPILLVSAAGIAINLAVAYLSSKWFYAQRFVLVEWPFWKTVSTGLRTWQYTLAFWLEVSMTALLLIVPAAVPAAWSSLAKTVVNLGSRRGLVALIVAGIVAFECVSWPAISIAPWLGDIVTPRGVLSGMELSGLRPIFIPDLAGEIIALVVIVIAWIFLTALADHIFRPRPVERLVVAFHPPGNRITIQCLLLFAAAYLAVVMVRAPRGFVYDRYSLPLIPCFSIPLLLIAQNSGGALRITLPICWALTIVWSGYAIACTQDVHALAAARYAAINRLHSAGVADTAIACGGECDNWTQLLQTGYINSAFINSPPGIYDPNLGGCPSLRCVYRVEYRPAADTIPSEFGSIDFISWLPPFHRRICIDRYRNPYWLDPDNHLPPPKDYEDLR